MSLRVLPTLHRVIHDMRMHEGLRPRIEDLEQVREEFSRAIDEITADCRLATIEALEECMEFSAYGDIVECVRALLASLRQAAAR